MQQSSAKDSIFSTKGSLRLGEKLLPTFPPLVMGILNLSPESFYYPGDRGSLPTADQVRERVASMLPYCDLIDVGAVSTRPGSTGLDEEEEVRRLAMALEVLVKDFPACPFSVDTYRARAAGFAIQAGAVMVNDISGGTLDPELPKLVAGAQVAYVLSHIQGKPASMQEDPSYHRVVEEILLFFAAKVQQLHGMGIHDILLDPGFGFGKTVRHNFEILSRLDEFKVFGLPILVGLSRKSMIQKTLGLAAGECLNGTSVLNTIALLKGADVLRVHDPKEAREAIQLLSALQTV